MKTLIPILGLFFIANTITAQQAKLLWADEFEKDGLPNPQNWSYDVGDHGWGNNELQYYTKEVLKNARVENGHLILEAHKDANFPKGYSSARIVTKQKAS